jgi:hypothetical protein
VDINSANVDRSQFCVHEKSLFRNPAAIKSVNVVVMPFCHL